MGYIKKSERVLANGHRVVSIYNGMWGGVSDRIEYNKNNEPIAYWCHGILAWGINVPVEINGEVYKISYEEYVAWRKDKELPKTAPMKQYHLS